MALQSRFKELMAHSVSVKAFLRRSTDGYGAPVYSTASNSYTARVTARHTVLPRPDGHTFVGDHVAWLATTKRIGLKDQFTFSGTTYEVLSETPMADDVGAHHQKLILRRSTG